MRLTAFYALMEEIAIKHKELLHTIDGRSSFTKHGDVEIEQDIPVGRTYPCIDVGSPIGQLVDPGEQITDMQSFSFAIMHNVNDATSFTEIETAQDRCKRIGFEIIGYLNRKREDEGSAGVVPYFDLNTVTYQFIGPNNNVEYGCLFRMTFSDEAFNRFSYDPSTYFNS